MHVYWEDNAWTTNCKTVHPSKHTDTVISSVRILMNLWQIDIFKSCWNWNANCNDLFVAFSKDWSWAYNLIANSGGLRYVIWLDFDEN